MLLIQILGTHHNLVQSSKHLSPYICATTTIPKHKDLTGLPTPRLDTLHPSLYTTAVFFSFSSFHTLVPFHCPRTLYEFSIALTINSTPPHVLQSPRWLYHPPTTSPPTCTLAHPISCACLSFSSNKPNSSHTSLHHSLLPRMLLAQLFLWLTHSHPSISSSERERL